MAKRNPFFNLPEKVHKKERWKRNPFFNLPEKVHKKERWEIKLVFNYFYYYF